ncbi:MAG: hypothetical protein NVS2B4_09360 [Ramlibacter sp.]
MWKNKAAAIAAACLVSGALAAAPAGGHDAQRQTAQAHGMAQWVRRSGDAGGRPFVVVDKMAAQLFVYRRDGHLLTSTPVLLGAALGDNGVPGTGDRAQTGTVPPEERTTPAGRFVTHPGRNRDGEAVVWIDYEAALAIHRLRPGRAHWLRAARLKRSDPADRRLSLGCVVVPVRFFVDVIEPVLGHGPGVVYVLPETPTAAAAMLEL